MQGISGNRKIIPGLTTVREIGRSENTTGLTSRHDRTHMPSPDLLKYLMPKLRSLQGENEIREMLRRDPNFIKNWGKFGNGPAPARPILDSKTGKRRFPTRNYEAAKTVAKETKPRLTAAHAPAAQKKRAVHWAEPLVAMRTIPAVLPRKYVPFDSAGFWHSLKGLCAGFANMPTITRNLISNNIEGVHCPAATAVSVSMDPLQKDRRSFLHANVIHLPAGKYPEINNAAVPVIRRNAIAGQSPQEFAMCERFFAKALDQQQGIFQFVSSNTHDHPGQTSEKTMLDQLQQQLTAAHQNGVPLVLAGRYKVLNLQELPTFETTDHRCVRVTVEAAGNPPTMKSIVITQAGLAFENSLLKESEISRAHMLMDANIKQGKHQSAVMPQDDPMVISYGGVGRTSVLITYREVLRRENEVHDKQSLDKVLSDIIVQGRQDRGPLFIHSEAQLSELREALVNALGLD